MASTRLAGRLLLSGSRIPGRQFTRLYTTAPPPAGGDNNANHHAKPRAPHHHVPTPPKRSVQPPPPSHSQAVPTPPGARHEVHEATQTLSAPYNPPGGGPAGGAGGGFAFTGSPVLDAILTTCIGLGAVFIGGVVYVQWYKSNVLDKIERAFEPGYDPALELAKSHTKRTEEPAYDADEPWTEYLRRKEQDQIDAIVKGEEPGHYFLLLGPKGSGKGTMIFEAMNAIQADGVSMCDAHPDLEVFRLRLGKALNYEFNEDTQTGLFQRRDPREGGAALDIERALNKLEKVALRCAKRRQKPFVLIINNIHFFQNDDEGRQMILQLQQRAETWAASGVMTVVFSSDDFWPFHVMRKSASRMHVLSVTDLEQPEAVKAVNNIRLDANKVPIVQADVQETVNIVGGRLSYLNRVAKAKNMTEMAKHMLLVEKGWILSQIGLIPDCDDDVMDEQKWSSCSWLLLQEFVKMRREQEQERQEAIDRGEVQPEDLNDLPLPAVSWYRARQIMTRADFLEELDKVNIIAIDINHDVRPDSMLTLRSAMEVVEEDGFQELLDGVRDRIDDIESLHRTRELTFKDLGKGDSVRLAVDKGGSYYVDLRKPARDDDDDDDD